MAIRDQVKKLIGGGDRPSLSDSLTLVRRYIVQETFEPLKRIGKALGFTLGGALLLGVGVVFGLIGLLRVIETETGTTFGGNWSFVPYVITAIGALGIMGIGILRGFRRSRSGYNSEE